MAILSLVIKLVSQYQLPITTLIKSEGQVREFACSRKYKSISGDQSITCLAKDGKLVQALFSSLYRNVASHALSKTFNLDQQTKVHIFASSSLSHI